MELRFIRVELGAHSEQFLGSGPIAMCETGSGRDGGKIGAGPVSRRGLGQSALGSQHGANSFDRDDPIARVARQQLFGSLRELAELDNGWSGSVCGFGLGTRI